MNKGILACLLASVLLVACGDDDKQPEATTPAVVPADAAAVVTGPDKSAGTPAEQVTGPISNTVTAPAVPQAPGAPAPAATEEKKDDDKKEEKKS